MKKNSSVSIIKKLMQAKPKMRERKSLNELITDAMHKPINQRDMRQESIDIGAHGAREYFGGGDDGRTV
jgi:hypothetical protein